MPDIRPKDVGAERPKPDVNYFFLRLPLPNAFEGTENHAPFLERVLGPFLVDLIPSTDLHRSSGSFDQTSI